ncbi:trypco2 family protein [Pseudomonas sp. Irchel 3H9]|uniref:trypco2 family protein n=1 Tax=Pseudomonas sp. Irchel 3H9 TaxID=2009043 RepID=UPI000BA32B1F|nr:trypco2 family protein [Pseudomonas sp. Irchel 3H9]
MKGDISLSTFIGEVKKELLASVDDANPFFDIGEVELEVSFTLEGSGKAGFKFVVVNADVSTKAAQTHKVKVKLTPFLVREAPPGGTPEEVGEVEGDEGALNLKGGAAASGASSRRTIKVAPQAKRENGKPLSKQPSKKDRSANA